MINLEISLEADEEKVLPFIFTDSAEEINFTAYLVGQRARLHVVGIFLGQNTRSMLFNTNIIHKAPQTKSRTTIRGVFFDSSSFANDGLVRIIKGAKGADGFFSSKILLFDHAKGRSVPSLEIDENEVKAGHASTVGKPDPSQLFYLHSRGITKKQADLLIVSGFFEPAVSFLAKNQQEEARRAIARSL